MKAPSIKMPASFTLIPESFTPASGGWQRPGDGPGRLQTVVPGQSVLWQQSVSVALVHPLVQPLPDAQHTPVGGEQTWPLHIMVFDALHEVQVSRGARA
jgi:hypothetical protein